MPAFFRQTRSTGSWIGNAPSCITANIGDIATALPSPAFMHRLMLSPPLLLAICITEAGSPTTNTYLVGEKSINIISRPSKHPANSPPHFFHGPADPQLKHLLHGPTVAVRASSCKSTSSKCPPSTSSLNSHRSLKDLETMCFPSGTKSELV